MELDARNISRLFRIYIHNIKKNRVALAKRFIAYIYLYGLYSCMVMYLSYNIHIADKPLGWFLVTLKIWGMYILYVIINHLLVWRVVSGRILVVFDLLSLITLLCIFITDSWVYNY